MNATLLIEMADIGIMACYALISLVALMGFFCCLKQREFTGAISFISLMTMSISLGLVWPTDFIDDLIKSFLNY